MLIARNLLGLLLMGTAGTRCRMLDAEGAALLGLLLTGTQGHNAECSMLIARNLLEGGLWDRLAECSQKFFGLYLSPISTPYIRPICFWRFFLLVVN